MGNAFFFANAFFTHYFNTITNFYIRIDTGFFTYIDIFGLTSKDIKFAS